MVAKRYLDVDPGHAGRGRVDLGAGTPPSTEAAGRVAALNVDAAVVPELDRIRTSRDRQRVGSIARGLRVVTGSTLTYKDARNRLPIRPGDGAGDVVPDRHLGVDPAHVGSGHAHERAGGPADAIATT